jgi:predicted RNA methylase
MEYFIPEALNFFIKDCDVLDIASYTGKSSASIKCMGARSVVGLEPRTESIEIAQDLIRLNSLDSVSFVKGDATDANSLTALLEGKDTVTNFGMFYHIADHHLFLKTICNSQVKHLILESEFGPECSTPNMDWYVETTDWDKAGFNGYASILAGVPNFPWVNIILELYGWQTVFYKAFYHDSRAMHQRFVIGAVNTRFVDTHTLPKLPGNLWEWNIVPNSITGREFIAYGL